MKTLFLYACLALLLTTGCKKTATKVTPPPTSRIEGVLAYRSSCQTNSPAPFPGQTFDGGPVVYLTDVQNYVKSGYVKPGADGRFSLAGVNPGEYRLRLAAGNLGKFWVGFPVTGIRIVVPATARKIDIGTVCADTVPPQNVEIQARWREADWSVAAREGIVHLEDAHGSARLGVWGEIDGKPVELKTEWHSRTDVLSVDGADVSWAPGTITGGVVAGMAGDGKGSFVSLEMPLRMHGARAEGKRVGGWLAFSDPATYVGFSALATEASVVADAAGAHMHALPGTTAAEASLVSSASFFAVTTAVSAVVNLARLDAGSEIELALNGPFSVAVAARLRADTEALILEIVSETDGVVAAAEVAAVPSAVIELTYDQATGFTTAAIGEFAPTQRISAVVSIPETRPMSRYAPALTARRSNGADGGFDITADGLFVAASTMVFQLPLLPQQHDDVVYDAYPNGSGTGAVGLIESGVYLGGAAVAVSMDEPRALSTYLITYEGNHTTLITENGADWVSLFSSIDASDREGMAPINGGSVMLY